MRAVDSRIRLTWREPPFRNRVIPFAYFHITVQSFGCLSGRRARSLWDGPSGLEQAGVRRAGPLTWASFGARTESSYKIHFKRDRSKSRAALNCLRIRQRCFSIQYIGPYRHRIAVRGLLENQISKSTATRDCFMRGYRAGLFAVRRRYNGDSGAGRIIGEPRRTGRQRRPRQRYPSSRPSLKNSVSVRPGIRQVTLTLVSLSSSRSANENELRNALVPL